MAEGSEKPVGGKKEAVAPPTTPRKQGRRPTATRRNLTGLEKTKGAAAAGMGGGTLVAIIANSLSDGLLKSILIWSAPTVTVVLTALWILVQRHVAEMWNDRERKRAYEAAKKAIDEALSNPALDPDERDRFEREKVKLDQLNVSKKMARHEEKL